MKGFSLLFPSNAKKKSIGTNPATWQDLDLDFTVKVLAGSQEGGINRKYLPMFTDILSNLMLETAAIQYRQEILRDILSNEQLEKAFSEVLPKIETLNQYYTAAPGEAVLYQVTRRLGELETYIDCIESLANAFLRKNPVSEGLSQLENMVQEIREDDVYIQMKTQLPDLINKVRGVKSITIGINLDHNLKPVEATLINVNKRQFSGKADTLVAKLFGQVKGEWTGIAPLRSTAMTAPATGEARERKLMTPLFRDLADVMDKTAKPVAQELKNYLGVQTGAIAGLAKGLPFYLAAVSLFRKLESSGMPVCIPEISDNRSPETVVTSAYNINLFLRELSENSTTNIVPNTMDIGKEGRIIILTGPNQGGKTTFTQAVGLIQVFAQTGLFVPAESAAVCIADKVLTHFPALEAPSEQKGRLGEEASRFREIFSELTPMTLLLLNEPFTSTSSGESVYLAKDIISILKEIDCRCVFATHLHELAADAEVLSQESTDQGRARSFVSIAEEDAEGVNRTYRIIEAPPRGKSYAQEVARHHGIGYDQLKELLRKRNLLH